MLLTQYKTSETQRFRPQMKGGEAPTSLGLIETAFQNLWMTWVTLTALYMQLVSGFVNRRKQNTYIKKCGNSREKRQAQKEGENNTIQHNQEPNPLNWSKFPTYC